MNPATHGTEGNAAAPVMYMALELSNQDLEARLERRRQVPAAVGAGGGSGAARLRSGEGEGTFRASWRGC
jgi:hypothetical protein